MLLEGPAASAIRATAAISLLIGERDIGLVAGDLGRILVVADRVGVAGVGRLPVVSQQILMLRTVRLLDIDHRQIGVGVLPDGPLGDIRLIPDERLDLIMVCGLDLDVGEIGEAGAQPFRNAEVGLRPPEADIVVDVIDRGDRSGVARDEVSAISHEANRG